MYGLSHFDLSEQELISLSTTNIFFKTKSLILNSFYEPLNWNTFPISSGMRSWIWDSSPFSSKRSRFVFIVFSFFSLSYDFSCQTYTAFYRLHGFHSIRRKGCLIYSFHLSISLDKNMRWRNVSEFSTGHTLLLTFSLEIACHYLKL